MAICERFVNFLQDIWTVDHDEKAFSLSRDFSSWSQGFGHHSTSRKASAEKRPLRSLYPSRWMDCPKSAGSFLSRAPAPSDIAQGLYRLRLFLRPQRCRGMDDRGRSPLPSHASVVLDDERTLGVDFETREGGCLSLVVHPDSKKAA